MEVKAMNCKEMKNFILECDGKIEKLNVAASVITELRSHLASCKKCAEAQERMLKMTASIASDKVEVPANLASDIINKVIPRKSAVLKVDTAPANEPSIMDRIAAALGMTRERFSFAAGFAVVAAAVIFGYQHFSNDANTPEKIADNKIEVNVAPQPVEPKFKKNNGIAERIAVIPEKVEPKFKKSIIGIERGSIAGGVKEPVLNEFYFVEGPEDLKISYKSAAAIILKHNSKFKMTDTGLVIKNGIAQIEVTPKVLNSFTVTTPDAFVEVTGTKFTVSRVLDETEVGVQLGSVRVTDTASGEKFNLTAGAKKLITKKAVKKQAEHIEEIFAETTAVSLGASTAEAALIEKTAETKIQSTTINNVINNLKSGNGEIK